ncbi:M56 family metallopeptidase [Peribacillus sp. Hz7]|uniref:M56 family metallopeptidase n=1 Tax=Peribacillus sp. Hz7 TaxID=3344873 RepID=UPI0035CB42C8
MRWWKHKSIFIISLSLLITILVWSQIGMYLAHVLLGTNLEKNLFTLCLSLFDENISIQFIISMFLNVLIAYTILMTLIKIGHQYFLLRRFKKKISQMVDTDLTKLLNRKFHRHKSDILVMQDHQLLAFTIGFRKSNIVLSTGLIEILEEYELNAVIEHETSHQKNNDSLKIFTLQLISQTIWFIPLTKWAYQNYKIISELLADQYAIHKTGSEAALGSALLKLIKHHFNRKPSPVLAHFSDESVNYRLKQLVNPHQAIPIKLKTTSIMASVHIMLLMTVMILVTMS